MFLKKKKQITSLSSPKPCLVSTTVTSFLVRKLNLGKLKIFFDVIWLINSIRTKQIPFFPKHMFWGCGQGVGWGVTYANRLNSFHFKDSEGKTPFLLMGAN